LFASKSVQTQNSSVAAWIAATGWALGHFYFDRFWLEVLCLRQFTLRCSTFETVRSNSSTITKTSGPAARDSFQRGPYSPGNVSLRARSLLRDRLTQAFKFRLIQGWTTMRKRVVRLRLRTNQETKPRLSLPRPRTLCLKFHVRRLT